MKLHAIMITRNDDLLIENWLDQHAALFDTIAVVDGSDSDFTKNACARIPHLRYTSDPEGLITDQTLRHHGFALIRDVVAMGDWIFIAHPDEFLIHNPRAFMERPENVMMWLPLHILPHPSEAEAWRATGGRNPRGLFRHFWWRKGKPPHCEHRMWRMVKEPFWDLACEQKSTTVIPANYHNEPIGEVLPLQLHYKCVDLRLSCYREDGGFTNSGLGTGLLVTIQTDEDLFFDEQHPFEPGWQFARFESINTLLERFGNPPRVAVLPSGEVVVVNNAGVSVT